MLFSVNLFIIFILETGLYVTINNNVIEFVQDCPGGNGHSE